jgi:predicted metal-dependent TIM-barrel fold hydrolase
MDNKKREYCVGVKIINCFYVEAENRTEAEEIVRNMDNDEILLDSDFNIEYADPTNGEVFWQIKSNEYNMIDDDHGNVLK